MPRGQGKPGFCKLCASPNAAEYIKGARTGGRAGDGWNAAEAQVHASKNGESINRQTWYSHRDHARTGGQRMIQAAEQARQSSPVVIKKSSNIELLEAIRDIGTAKALNNPDEVTLDHALKAVQIMEGKKDKGSDSLNILVQFITGNAPALLIEGTARDVTQEAITE